MLLCSCFRVPSCFSVDCFSSLSLDADSPTAVSTLGSWWSPAPTEASAPSPSSFLTVSSWTVSDFSFLSFFTVNLKPTNLNTFLKPTSLAWDSAGCTISSTLLSEAGICSIISDVSSCPSFVISSTAVELAAISSTRSFSLTSSDSRCPTVMVMVPSIFNNSLRVPTAGSLLLLCLLPANPVRYRSDQKERSPNYPQSIKEPLLP